MCDLQFLVYMVDYTVVHGLYMVILQLRLAVASLYMVDYTVVDLDKLDLTTTTCNL